MQHIKLAFSASTNCAILKQVMDASGLKHEFWIYAKLISQTKQLCHQKSAYKPPSIWSVALSATTSWSTYTFSLQNQCIERTEYKLTQRVNSPNLLMRIENMKTDQSYPCDQPFVTC